MPRLPFWLRVVITYGVLVALYYVVTETELGIVIVTLPGYVHGVHVGDVVAAVLTATVVFAVWVPPLVRHLRRPEDDRWPEPEGSGHSI